MADTESISSRKISVVSLKCNLLRFYRRLIENYVRLRRQFNFELLRMKRSNRQIVCWNHFHTVESIIIFQFGAGTSPNAKKTKTNYPTPHTRSYTFVHSFACDSRTIERRTVKLETLTSCLSCNRMELVCVRRPVGRSASILCSFFVAIINISSQGILSRQCQSKTRHRRQIKRQRTWCHLEICRWLRREHFSFGRACIL